MVREIRLRTDNRACDPAPAFRRSSATDTQNPLLSLEKTEGSRLQSYALLAPGELLFFDEQVATALLEEGEVRRHTPLFRLELSVVDDSVLAKEEGKKQISRKAGDERNPELHYLTSNGVGAPLL